MSTMSEVYLLSYSHVAEILKIQVELFNVSIDISCYNI